MTVWAVIAHYGGEASTRRLIQALRAATMAPERILVIDNQGGSAFEEDELVHVLRPPQNLGYSAAAAAGSELALPAGAEWVWLLNNDAEPAGDCLERLLEAGAALPGAGILSPVIVYREGGGCWYAGGAVSRRTLGVRHLARSSATAPYATAFVTGCAPLLRARALDTIGPLDDGLFMYYEDVDWSLRMTDAGWSLAVAPAAVVVHDVPRRGARRVFSDGAIYFMTRNRMLVAGRHGRRLPAAVAGAGWALRQIAKSPGLAVALGRTRAALLGTLHGFAGRRGPAPAAVTRTR